MLYRNGDTIRRNESKSGNFIPYDPDAWKSETRFTKQFLDAVRHKINEHRQETLKRRQLLRTKYL